MFAEWESNRGAKEGGWKYAEAFGSSKGELVYYKYNYELTRKNLRNLILCIAFIWIYIQMAGWNA